MVVKPYKSMIRKVRYVIRALKLCGRPTSALVTYKVSSSSAWSVIDRSKVREEESVVRGKAVEVAEAVAEAEAEAEAEADPRLKGHTTVAVQICPGNMARER